MKDNPFAARRYDPSPSSAVGRLRLCGWLAIVALLPLAALPATRPHYGGALRVEIRESIDAPDSPLAQRRMGSLTPAFKLEGWDAGRRALYVVDDNAPGGRPFLDSIEVEMGRSLREQSIDLGLGRADIVELGTDELRRQAAGRRVWSSAPIRVIAVVFHPRIEDARIREALALAVDRAAIHNVLLQRQGEITAALLPQWISGYAFLFSTTPDLARARSLLAAVPAAARRLTLAAEEPAMQPIAERIAVNARDAGLAVTVAPRGTDADARLVERRIGSSDPARALAALAASLGLPEPASVNTPDALYAAERSLLDGSRIIPLVHLPDVYGVAPRVKDGPGITPLGEWRFENLWVESGRP